MCDFVHCTVERVILYTVQLNFCVGAGSRLDLDSIGSADSDPDWESGFSISLDPDSSIYPWIRNIDERVPVALTPVFQQHKN